MITPSVVAWTTTATNKNIQTKTQNNKKNNNFQWWLGDSWELATYNKQPCRKSCRCHLQNMGRVQFLKIGTLSKVDWTKKTKGYQVHGSPLTYPKRYTDRISERLYATNYQGIITTSHFSISSSNPSLQPLSVSSWLVLNPPLVAILCSLF